MKKIILAQHDNYNFMYAFNLAEQPFPTNGDYCIVDTKTGLKLVKVIMSGYVNEEDEYCVTCGKGRITADVVKIIPKEELKIKGKEE